MWILSFLLKSHVIPGSVAIPTLSCSFPPSTFFTFKQCSVKRCLLISPCTALHTPLNSLIASISLVWSLEFKPRSFSFLDVFYSWVSSMNPIVLCAGPKTMTPIYIPNLVTLSECHTQFSKCPPDLSSLVASASSLGTWPKENPSSIACWNFPLS